MGKKLNWILKKTSKNALPLAVLTATAEPSSGYLERALAVFETPWNLGVDFYNAFTNYSAAGKLEDIKNAIIEPLQNAGINLQDNPEQVLYAGLGVYVATKLSRFVIPPTVGLSKKLFSKKKKKNSKN